MFKPATYNVVAPDLALEEVDSPGAHQKRVDVCPLRRRRRRLFFVFATSPPGNGCVSCSPARAAAHARAVGWVASVPAALGCKCTTLSGMQCVALRGPALFARVGVTTDVHAACMGCALVWSDRHAAASRSARCTPLAMLHTAVSTCKAWYSISRLSILN